MANGVEMRFAYLLKPIHELAKNWEIDIASDLEGYLEEIDQITVTFDDGKTSMNFAEAALLIQGSTCIYSKKVEYLYGLVYQVLDLVASKKKLLQAGSVDAEGRDRDVAQNDVHQDEEAFLTLDDIKTYDNVNMKNDDDNNEKALRCIPRTPMALIRLDNTQKGDNLLLSKTGEVLGNLNDFKVNASHFHPCGTMLLDMSHLSLLELSLQSKPTSTPVQAASIPVTTEAAGAGGDEQGLPPMDLQTDEGIPADISIDDDIDPGLDVDDHDSQAENEKVDRMKLRERKKLVTAVPKPVINHLQVLDPHETNTAAVKPFRKARTARIPLYLDTEGNKKRKRKIQKEGKVVPILNFCMQAYFGTSSQLPKRAQKSSSFAEFEHLYWTEVRRRQIKTRKDRKLLVENGRLAEVGQEEQEEKNEQELDRDFAAADGDDGIDEEDVPFPDVQDLIHQDEPERDGLERLHQGEDEAPILTSYEDLVRHHVEGFMQSAQQYAQVTELSKRVAEWEEKIRPRLEEEERRTPFDIHKYGSTVLQTFLTPSANKSVIPFKTVVENRPSYEVCRLFLATLQLVSSNNVEIVSGANNYNVEIIPGGMLEAGVDTMAMKLLSNKRHFQELEDYLAPSLQK